MEVVKLMAMVRAYGECCRDELPMGAARELVAIEDELRTVKEELERLRKPDSHLVMGKSGPLKVSPAAAVRALMAADVAAGRREVPDI